jgi:archaellum biogenesis ATPase FlaH
MDRNDPIEGALSQAGAPQVTSPDILKLEQIRITPQKDLQPMEFLFRLCGKPCFPRGELVAITGKAKSGKTFLTSMLMTCCQVRDVLCLHREREEPLRVMWYDTEQSDESTQDILKHRLVPMTGDNVAAMDVFNVRAMPWQQRRLLLGEAIAYYEPDLVVVDGIRDLVNDINDGVLAQEVMEELLHLASGGKKCCIACILHQNKGSEDHNLRGWIGTELMNKAFEVYACEKLLPQRIFAVEQTLTRKYDIEQTMYFEVGTDGLPALCGVPVAESTPAVTEKLPKLNNQYIVHDDGSEKGWRFDVVRLFTDAMGGQSEMGHFELQQRVMELTHLRSYQVAASIFKQGIEQKAIVKRQDSRGRVVYQAPPF